jgi:hypothetical protein
VPDFELTHPVLVNLHGRKSVNGFAWPSVTNRSTSSLCGALSMCNQLGNRSQEASMFHTRFKSICNGTIQNDLFGSIKRRRTRRSTQRVKSNLRSLRPMTKPSRHGGASLGHHVDLTYVNRIKPFSAAG